MNEDTQYFIASKKDFSKFYLAILARVLFFLILGLLVGVLYKEALSTIWAVVMIIMSISLIYLAFYTVFRYYKNAPSIEVNSDLVKINNDEYYWKDLEEIRLTGKQHFKFFIMGNERESTAMKFKDHDEIYFFDDMYQNSAVIKLFIQQHVALKSSVKINEPVTVFSNVKYNIDSTASDQVSDINAGGFKFYKGYSFLCFEGICQWTVLMLFIYSIIAQFIHKSNHGFIIGSLCLTLFVVSLSYRRMYYFGISNNEFIVRNQVLFWVKKVYEISNIREIVFEQKFRMPISLRLITKDFESDAFYAASLWSVKWRGLKKEFEDKGINVRVEVSIEQLNIVNDIASDFRNIIKDVFNQQDQEK